MPLWARVPSHIQPRPSAAEEHGLALWGDLFGYPSSDYGYGGYGHSGEGGSHPPSALSSDDENDGRDADDADDDE